MVVNMLTGLVARVQTKAGLSTCFPIGRGICQGCPLSPILFVLSVSQAVVTAARLPSIQAAGVAVPALWMFADDISFAACNPQTAQQALHAIDQALAPLGLAIAPAKCEILEVNGGAKPALIKLNNTAIPHSTEGWKLLGIVFEEKGWGHQQQLARSKLRASWGGLPTQASQAPTPSMPGAGWCEVILTTSPQLQTSKQFSRKQTARQPRPSGQEQACLHMQPLCMA